MSRLPLALAAAALLALGTGASARAQQGTGSTTTVPSVPQRSVPTTSTPSPAAQPPRPAAPPNAQAPQPAPASTAAPGAADGRIAQAAARKDTTGAPPAVVALVVLGVLLVLGAVLVGAARWWAWEPSYAPRLRHASAEAGWRVSAGWADFRDWLRLGR